MRLSQEIDVNNEKCQKFSKCGRYLACGSQNVLNIINVGSFEVTHTFLCDDRIEAVDWHRDSDLVLCLLYNLSRAQAFSLSDPEWVGSLHGGEIGLKDVFWSPRGHFVLALAQMNVRISVWSLTGRLVTCIDNPILKETNHFSFSNDENYFAVVVGPLVNYRLLIYSTSTWVLCQEIKCSGNVNVPSEPLWSPLDIHLALWETCDMKTVFLEVYSVEQSKLCGSFKETGLKLNGICQVSWVPSGQFLLVGCRNEFVYVLNYITWGVFAVLKHLQVVDEKHCQVQEEVKNEDRFYCIEKRPVVLSKLKLDSKLPGVVCITCDTSGTYIATQCSSMPAVLWIWEAEMFNLKSVIILRDVLSDISWNFDKKELLICSKSSIALWKPKTLTLLSSSLGCDLSSCNWCPGEDKFSMVKSSSMYIVSLHQ